MKHLKKLASLALALVMVMALAVPAFAEVGKATVKFPAEAGHTYKLWQIFVGNPDVAGTGTTTAPTEGTSSYSTPIAWGSGITDGKYKEIALGVYNLVKDDAKYASAKTVLENLMQVDATGNAALKTEGQLWSDDAVAFAVAQAIGLYAPADKSTEAENVRDVIRPCLNAAATYTGATGGQLTDVPMGWYMVEDTKTENSQTVVTNSLLRVNGAIIEIKIKSNKVPDFDKEVAQYNVDATLDPTWGNYAIYPAPDVSKTTETQEVKFKLSAPLPEDLDFDKQNQYQIIFHDELEKTVFEDFDVTKANVTVTIVPKTGEPRILTVGRDYKIVSDTAGEKNNFDIQIDNIWTAGGVDEDGKTLLKADDTIVVEYKAFLTSQAQIGGDGNINKAHMKYGANGKTNDVETPVFTFKLDLSKVEPNKNAGGNNANTPLTGAAFKLERRTTAVAADATDKGDGYNWAVVRDYSDTDTTKTSEFAFTGLPVGIYKLTETVTPDGYHGLSGAIYFEIKAVVEPDTSTGKEVVKSLTAVQVKDATGAAFEGDPLVQFSNGKLSTGEVSVESGALATTVINTTGATLPETGGIGTTIFYIVGGVLLVGAVVLLIAKRRTSADEE